MIDQAAKSQSSLRVDRTTLRMKLLCYKINLFV